MNFFFTKHFVQRCGQRFKFKTYKELKQFLESTLRNSQFREKNNGHDIYIVSETSNVRFAGHRDNNDPTIAVIHTAYDLDGNIYHSIRREKPVNEIDNLGKGWVRIADIKKRSVRI